MWEKKKFQNTDMKNKNLVLITPTYGENNLLKICGKDLIKILLQEGFTVMLRPHYKILKDSKKLIKSIIESFGNNPNFILEEGIIPSEKFHNSKCMISDWSGISLEYAFTFERPVILIDLPKKNLNPNSGDIPMEPIEISIREKIGHVVSPNNLEKIPEIIKNLDNDNFSEQIRKIRSELVYNIGKSAKIGAEIIEKNLHGIEK